MTRRSSPLVKLADLLFLARPPLVCASSTFFFAGAISSLRAATGSYRISLMPQAMPNLALFVLVVSVAFVVNQIFDIKSDAINKKNFILPLNAVTRVESIVFLGLLCAAVAVLLHGRDRLMILLVCGGLALGVCYSTPPVRLKGRPVADLLANVAGFGWIGFLMGWLGFSDFGRESLVRSVPYAIAMGAIFLNTCIPDEEGDRAAGDCTACVAFGKKFVSIAALVLMCSAVPAGIMLDEPVCVIAAMGAVPAFAAVAIEPTSANSVVASQLAAWVLFVLVCVAAPILAGMGVVTYVLARIYYARRFGVGYPRLTGANLDGSKIE